MKKRNKKILGVLGLAFVVLTTVFAANLPSASAAGNADTIIVRVTGQTPSIKITSPSNGLVSTRPLQNLSFNYENLENIFLSISYTDKDGSSSDIVSPTYYANYESGSDLEQINLNTFGYGDYIFKVEGDGAFGFDEDAVSLKYIPVITNVEYPEEGDPIINYDYDNSQDEGCSICKLSTNIYTKNRTLLTNISPIVVETPVRTATIPFAANDIEPGDFIIETTAYSCDDEELYTNFIEDTTWEQNEDDDEDIDVPNTGSFIKDLNITRTDYMITGLVVFFSFAILMLVFTIKRKSHKK